MNVAVICLAYLGNPSGIRLLSKYFMAMDAHLFVHVDAKAPLDPYRIDESNVTLLLDRREVFWGGFNTVEAAIASIEFARKAASFDRFIFTTEDSIPLISPAEMESRLKLDVDWIAIHGENPAWVWERYNNYFYFDSRATSFRYFEAIERHITGKDLRCFERMQGLMKQGKTKLPELYHGCGWWALSARTVEAILERHHSDRRLRESFEFSAIPEEQYFHTIIGLSEVSRPRRNFMYVDWDRDENVKPYVFSRYEEIGDVQKKNPELLFLRKASLDSDEVWEYVLGMLE